MTALTTTQSPSGLVPQTMSDAIRLSELMATGNLVPQHLQKSPGDCLMVVEQAMRWNMSPFAVAQSTSVIQGKLMFEGKLVAAAVQASGVLEGRLDYEFTGKGADLSVKVIGTIRGEKKRREVDVTLAGARTNNHWWTKTPEQMLSYHGARVWARRHAPEVMLGVYSPDEIDTTRDAFSGITIDAMPEPAAQPQPVDHVAVIRDRLAKCSDRACVERLSDTWQRTVARASEAGRPISQDVGSDVMDLIADAYSRFAEGDEPTDEFAAMEDVP
jgi:RecT family